MQRALGLYLRSQPPLSQSMPKARVPLWRYTQPASPISQPPVEPKSSKSSPPPAVCLFTSTKFLALGQGSQPKCSSAGKHAPVCLASSASSAAVQTFLQLNQVQATSHNNNLGVLLSLGGPRRPRLDFVQVLHRLQDVLSRAATHPDAALHAVDVALGRTVLPQQLVQPALQPAWG